MLTGPRVDLICEPDPARLEVRDRLREVRPTGKPMHLLPAHPQDLCDLGDPGEP